MNEMKECAYLPDPRHKCSVPDNTWSKKRKLMECQRCFIWEIIFEQHQEDVL